MNNKEFSNEFDILYNNLMSNNAAPLNEYEKSVLLTQSQESIVIDIYNGRFNGESFENTEEVTEYISNLVKEVTLSGKIEKEAHRNSIFFQLPEDLWFITYESVNLSDESLGCANNKDVIVVPVSQDNFYNVSRNPFRGPNDRRVLRLTIGTKAELVSKYNIKSYTVRYLSRPDPIILEDLTGYGVSINNETKVTECKLNPVIHRAILNRAVSLAKAIWSSGA